MKKTQIIAAWRDEDYYLSLSMEDRAALPAHPAGITGIGDEALRSITGGCSSSSTHLGGCGASTGICTPCPPVHCY